MKVKIIKSSGKDYWYKDSIGEVFDVRPGSSPTLSSGSGFWVLDDNYCRHIDGQDCEIIQENTMQLKHWIKTNGYTYRSFGAEIGIDFRNIEKWSRGETLPRFNFAKKIFDFTNNEVTGHDFYEKQIQRHQTDL